MKSWRDPVSGGVISDKDVSSWQTTSVADIIRNPSLVATSMAEMKGDLPNLDLLSLLKKYPPIILMVSQLFHLVVCDLQKI